MVNEAPEKANRSLIGHLGIHFDVMNKESPLEFTRRNGIVFDASLIRDRHIPPEDIAISKAAQNMFVAFPDYIEEVSYGCRTYFASENLCNLKSMVSAGPRFTAHAYPVNCAGIAGLPYPAIAKA